MDKKKLMIIGGVVVVLLVASAVNRFVKQSATERALEAATGGKVDVDANGKDVTVKTNQGTWSTSDRLPDDFPTDIPIYRNATVQGSLSSSDYGNNGQYVGLASTDKLADVISWYKKEVPANGWTITTDAMINGSLMLSATKEKRILSVAITGEDGKVTMSLTSATQ